MLFRYTVKQFFRGVFICLLAVLISPGWVCGEITIAPGATTHKQFQDLELAFYRRTMVEAYRRDGYQDPQWDRQALWLLDETAKTNCGLRGAASIDERVKVGREVLQAGCRDSLVRYCYGVALHAQASRRWDNKVKDEAVNVVYQAVMELQCSLYPENQKFAGCVSLWKLYKKPQRTEASFRLFLNQIYDLAHQMVESDLYGVDEKRLLVKHIEILNDDDLFPLEQTQLLCEKVKNADSWVVKVMRGRYHAEQAWAERGGGWASTVKEEGWGGFEEHLTHARGYLTEAAEQFPRRPEAAMDMIRVSMGSSEDSYSEMRRWFNLATKAQFDYEPAYRALLWGLYPRWHGSHEAMYEFGLECAGVDRYDTMVPYFLVIALGEIHRDLNQSFGFWELVGAYKHLDRVLTRYAAEPAAPHSRQWYLTRLAFYAWKTDHVDRAYEVLDELQDRLVDAEALEWFNTKPEELIGQVRVQNGPLGQEYSRAVEIARAGRHAESLAVFEDLIAAGHDSDAVLRLLRSRAQSLRHRMAFDAGEWVKLKADDRWIEWRPVYGHWQAEADGSFVGTSSEEGLMAVCDTIFGIDWEFQGEIEVIATPYRSHRPGVVIGHYLSPPWFVFLMNPWKHEVVIGRLRSGRNKNGDHVKIKTSAVGPDHNHFTIRVSRGILKAWINDEMVVDDHQIEAFPMNRNSRIGIGGHYRWEGAQIRYKNLRIRQYPHADIIKQNE